MRSLHTAAKIGGLISVGGGAYWLGVTTERNRGHRSSELPSGQPRSCVDCDAPDNITVSQKVLPDTLRRIVGQKYVISDNNASAAYTTGARIGKGEALAVCMPGTLNEAVSALRACVEADVAIIPQGRNTGLTGGSVPRSELCDRPTVVLNLTRLNKIHPVGDKMLCLAGAGIYDLSKYTASLNPPRESHSILGSVFLNPSVAAGVAFGSGGTQLRKGPAYTERAVWCKINDMGEVELVNTLGVVAHSEEELLGRLESGTITPKELDDTEDAMRPASDAHRYCKHVCKFDDEVSRFNADTSGIEPCRSEGKVLILATLHDTFPVPLKKKTYWIACSSLSEAQQLKRDVFMKTPEDLPVSCEYMDRDSVDVVDRAGRILCFAINVFGIGEKLSKMWGLKLWVESLPLPYFDTVVDKLLYLTNNLLLPSLPTPLHKLSKKYDHHLLVTLGEYGSGNLKRTEDLLSEYSAKNPDVVIQLCSDEDVPKITYFRFAAAPAFRTWCVGKNAQGLSIDYAQSKRDTRAPDFPFLNDESKPLVRMRYAHLGCNVVHEDIAFHRGVDLEQCKSSMKHVVEAEGGKLPAEHGHGTEYTAPPEVQKRWREMDPRNVLNPGVGGLEYGKDYKS
jgi:D-lactate dehydrogenase